MRRLTVLTVVTLAACGGNGGTTNGPPPPVAPGVTAIYDVQGSGSASPLNGQSVIVQGVVVGDFQEGDADDTSNIGGFYIQSVPDADFATSDGVFVFDGNNPAVDVDVGDVVRVEGMVNEYFGETQISTSSVTITGSGAILPFSLILPATSTIANSDGDLLPDLERFEGMLVRFPQTLTVSQTRELERFGEVQLSSDGRQFSFTNRNAPDVAGYSAHLQAIASGRIYLDDGLRATGAAPVRYLNAGAAAGYSIRLGDEIADLTGVLRYSRGSGGSGTEAYRLMPTIAPQFESVNSRPVAPTVSGSLHIVSFNLNNFFSTIDDGSSICGPSGDGGCRGANSAEELARQLSKIVNAIGMLDADIVGLVELENNASASLQSLVDALNASLGAGTYAYVDTGTIGDQVIKVGLLYKPSSTSLAGAFAVLDSSVDALFDDTRSRPVLAQTFQQVSNSARLTVLVNHLKSKGSSCASSGDPDLGDGQQNCSATRNAAAAAVVDWIATDPTTSGDADFLFIGDPNAHTFDDAITTFRNAGYTDLAEAFIGDDSYSFEFDGQSGALDHALASTSLLPQVVDVDEWHANADEPRVLNYDLDFGRDPGLFDATTPYRASDHDPILIGLDLVP